MQNEELPSWPPRSIERAEAQETKRLFLEHTKRYLRARTSHKLIRASITGMRRKHLNLDIFPIFHGIPADEEIFSDMLETEHLTPIEAIELAKQIEKMSLEARMHFRKLHPDIKKNDILRYTRNNHHEIIDVSNGATAEIINSFSDE